MFLFFGLRYRFQLALMQASQQELGMLACNVLFCARPWNDVPGLKQVQSERVALDQTFDNKRKHLSRSKVFYTESRNNVGLSYNAGVA